MSYGLRRYEALHRLWWLAFFLLCLFLAGVLPSFTSSAQRTPSLAGIGTLDFWTGLHGVDITSAAPLEIAGKKAATDEESQTGEEASRQNVLGDDISMVSGALLFLIRVGVIFLVLRLLWLVVQYAGRYLLQLTMSEIRGFEPSERGAVSRGTDPLLPVQALEARIRQSIASFVLHPFIRLRLTLSGFHGNVSSENVFEGERRAVEADWRILYGSWGPYRCLLWLLPVLGLAQTVLLLIAQFNGLGLMAQKGAAGPLLDPAIQKQIISTIKPVFSLLLPLIQAAGVALFLQLAAVFLRHLEELYLSSLDAFLYDRLLSRLPATSSDPTRMLEMLQRQMKEFGAALERLERRLLSPAGVDRQR